MNEKQNQPFIAANAEVKEQINKLLEDAIKDALDTACRNVLIVRFSNYSCAIQNMTDRQRSFETDDYNYSISPTEIKDSFQEVFDKFRI